MDVCIHELDVGTCSLCAPGRVRSRRAASGSTGETASVHFDQGTVELDCPYDAEFVDELKGALPGHARRWDGDRRVWVISSEWWDAAADVISGYFDLLE